MSATAPLADVSSRPATSKLTIWMLVSLVLLSLWLMLRATDGELRWKRFLVAGVAMVLLALTRPTDLLLPVILTFFLPRT